MGLRKIPRLTVSKIGMSGPMVEMLGMENLIQTMTAYSHIFTGRP